MPIEDLKFDILDHGFIRVVDYMGNDSSIVQAARVSYGAGTKKVNEDAGLINYLLRNSHTTPFEMCEIKFHIKAPYFVARQWIRHRTANVNEYSARYSIVDTDYYVPEIDVICKQSKSNKQGRGELISEEVAKKIKDGINAMSKNVYLKYQSMIEFGVAREIARIILPLNYYTEFYWKIDLHNLMHFLKLRSDEHAQYEIRVYALKMLEILKMWVPLTYSAFENFKLNATNLSKRIFDVIKKMARGDNINEENSGLTSKEWAQVQTIINN